jgi:hypothetical protein
MRAAEELGYQPNVIARALVLQRSYALGIIVPDLRIRSLPRSSVARSGLPLKPGMRSFSARRASGHGTGISAPSWKGRSTE